MKLENIDTAKALIRELDLIKALSKELTENAAESSIEINGCEFKVMYRDVEVAKDFIKDINETLKAKCEDYISIIEKRLKKL
jgi:hypothetical protein